jgi:hypothetical protein
MAKTVTKTVVIDGSSYPIVQTYSDSVLWKDGTRIVSFRVLNTEYDSGDTVTVVFDGAKDVLFASCKKINATAEIALTRATTSSPPGKSVSTGAITGSVTLEFFVVYSVESIA